MPKLDLVPGDAPAAVVGGFEFSYVSQDGLQRIPPTDAGLVLFESCSPVRTFPSWKGQRHHVGQWWTATTGTLVGYESWLERDRLVLLDFDHHVVGIASQPFWLFFDAPNGKRRSHAPDYFARLADGSALVLDCRPAERIKPKDQVAFDATRQACALLGWRYEVVDAPASALLANVRWL
ncbi:TnsA-like heteromeric transposase endonuclease subunit [Saccharothrix sp. ALI-22-I]|uniref:TnsA-like heteromeric transposase endonuclease subunit n=1 Tax=Saccharothrix sp. ALI-22-I TaxID=1933778 RepID=UPI001930F643|nr:TnsA-like heteromeric transposase endonuclease subunit [Saccharothrix sp. ALI-22-I]